MGCKNSKSEKITLNGDGPLQKLNISGAGLKTKSKQVQGNLQNNSTFMDTEGVVDMCSNIDFVSEVIKLGQPWTDEDFPPIPSSLYNVDTATVEG